VAGLGLRFPTLSTMKLWKEWGTQFSCHLTGAKVEVYAIPHLRIEMWGTQLQWQGMSGPPAGCDSAANCLWPVRVRKKARDMRRVLQSAIARRVA
jgi:hypothetical protein